jgi:hypothetical protein
MLQAIVTRYHGPTNHKGSRISARAEAGRIFRHYDHALDAKENHAQAALDLAESMGWLRPGTRLHGGALPGNAGYCFVKTREG